MPFVAHTTPYPWPYDGELRQDALTLVVAGADPAWHARVADGTDWLTRIRGVAAAVLAASGHVVALDHRGVSPDTDLLDGLAASTWLRVPGVDGFYAGPLDGLLRAEGRTLLAMCGFGLEGPVHSTLRSANDRGYECLTLRDACAPLDPSIAGAAYSQIEMSGGIFGAVGTSAELLRSLTTVTTLEAR